jgi:hypothetical protein
MTIATGTADTGPPAPRKRGRPITTGTTPQRNAGRHGKIWDDCVKQADADGQTMTDFVRDAITRELDRRRNLAETGVIREIRHGDLSLTVLMAPPVPAHPDDCVCGHDGCQGETARAVVCTNASCPDQAFEHPAHSERDTLEDAEADQ